MGQRDACSSKKDRCCANSFQILWTWLRCSSWLIGNENRRSMERVDREWIHRSRRWEFQGIGKNHTKFQWNTILPSGIGCLREKTYPWSLNWERETQADRKIDEPNTISYWGKYLASCRVDRNRQGAKSDSSADKFNPLKQKSHRILHQLVRSSQQDPGFS